MRVTLVVPSYISPKGATDSRVPLGVCYLGAILKSHSHTVSYCDMSFDPVDWDCDVIGVSVWTHAFSRARVIAQEAKARGIYCIAGGPHAWGDAQSLLDAGFDAVCVGDGEPVICDMVENQPKGIIKGYVEDLDSLPLPDIEWTKSKPYPSHTHGWLQTSRGCPGKCIFCGRVNGDEIRRRSPAHVVDELLALWQNKKMEFVDDCMTADKQWVMNLCEEARARGVKLYSASISNGTRADCFDSEMLTAMRSGIHLTNVMIGLESAHPDVLRTIAKGVTAEQVETAFQVCKAQGITPGVFMMIGLPGSTAERDLYSIAWAHSQQPIFSNWSMVMALPGTPMVKWVDKHGHWLCDPRDYNSSHHVMWETSDYSAKERLEVWQKAHDELQRA